MKHLNAKYFLVREGWYLKSPIVSYARALGAETDRKNLDRKTCAPDVDIFIAFEVDLCKYEGIVGQFLVSLLLVLQIFHS